MSILVKALATSAVLSLFSSSISLANNGFGNGKMHGQGMGKGNQSGACLSKMNLSKEQSDKITILHKDFDPKHEAISTQMRDLHKQLRDLNLAKAGSDKTNPILEKISILRTEQQKLRTDMHTKMQTILTAEQLATCPNMGSGNGNHEGMKHKGW